MAEPRTAKSETPSFDTSDVEANLAIEQGLGVGARELAAIGESGAKGTLELDDGADERRPARK